MSATPLERLKEIFHSARELPPSEREAFLTGACGSDEQLRQEIEALLESDRATDDFIADPPAKLVADAFGDSPDSSEAGRMIGHYRLIECIGSGGMGAVYLAERADQQFQMQVAIKLIKRGMDTDSVLRRFQHERQILASLEHPNIARLLDGGTTEDGVPYFVMEYIEGDRIDRYAEEHRLSISERLELFRQVCGAVSYAHQRLVVHRDLKPSNVLVTPAGVPKLLDFGIAKIIQPNDSAETLPTITAVPIMTPEYASPEQIRGQPVTTASDVYSLGLVLYELLCGCSPYKFPSQSPSEMARVITEAEPKRPSTAIREVDKSKFGIRNSKLLKGDLDNIVRMAMRKETARRYRSVEQFSEDIRRHLTGRPVVAQPDTLSYRSAKFLRRNRLGVSAAALLFLTLVGGIVATAWQAQRATIQEHRARAEQARAERRFNDVRKLANSVLFDYYDAIKALPGSTKVRERLVKDALNYLDSLAGEAHGDPELQRELAAAYERVGDVRGGTSSGGSLGDLSGAIESYTKALRIREALVVTNPGNVQARRDLATSHQRIGNRLLETAEASNGLEHLRKALEIRLDLTREQPANDDLQFDLAVGRNQLGGAMRRRNDLVGALEQHRAALAICERLSASHPREQRYRRTLWTCYNLISNSVWLQKDIPGAIEANSKARALAEGLIADDPINTAYRRGLVLLYQQRGEYREQSDPQGALNDFRKAVALDEELLVADPANALTRKDLGYLHKRVADFLVKRKDWSQALFHFSKALEIFEKLGSDAPADLLTRFRGATCRAGGAGMQAQLGEIDPALDKCRKTIALLRGITEDTTSVQHRMNRAETHEYVAHAYLALAASPKVSGSDSRQYMSSARDMFQQALNIINDVRESAGDLGLDEEWARKIAGEIAKCDAVLGK